MPAFKIESNMPIILLIIVIALVSLFFFLDLKKVKLQLDELEEKNTTVMKEIDNIHMQLHKFFSRMPQRIIPRENIPRENMTRENMTRGVIPRGVMPRENIQMNNGIAKVSNVNNSSNVNNPPNVTNPDNVTTHDFDKLKNQPVNNDIFSEISPSNDKIDSSLPNLEPIVYDDKVDVVEDSEVDDLNSDSDNDSDNGSDSGSENLNIEDLSEEDSNKLDLYMEMSVKDLKSKCIEMNLKHSGNKSVLAKRIVDNL